MQVMGCEDKELDIRAHNGAVPGLIPAEGSEGPWFLWQQPLLEGRAHTRWRSLS